MKCYAIENYLNADSVEQRETFKLINTQTYARDERTVYSYAGVEQTSHQKPLLFLGIGPLPVQEKSYFVCICARPLNEC